MGDNDFPDWLQNWNFPQSPFLSKVPISFDVWGIKNQRVAISGVWVGGEIPPLGSITFFGASVSRSVESSVNVIYNWQF